MSCGTSASSSSLTEEVCEASSESESESESAVDNGIGEDNETEAEAAELKKIIKNANLAVDKRVSSFSSSSSLKQKKNSATTLPQHKHVYQHEPQHREQVIATFFPICDHSDSDSAGGTHWSLAVLEHSSNTLSHYDSLSSRDNHDKARFLAGRLSKALGRTVALRQESVPRQTNGYDCGMYVISITEYLCRVYSEEETQYQLADFVAPHALAKSRRHLYVSVAMLCFMCIGDNNSNIQWEGMEGR